MKVETHVDPWGGVRLEVKGESVHENALLDLLGRKGIDSCSIGTAAGTHEPTSAILSIAFYAVPGQSGSDLQRELKTV